jgi:hypothetical protein
VEASVAASKKEIFAMPELSLIVPKKIISAAEKVKPRRPVVEILRQWIETGYEDAKKKPKKRKPPKLEKHILRFKKSGRSKYTG